MILILETFFYRLDICDKGKNFTMCPRCDEKIGCKPWTLNDSCGQAMVLVY